ncbi:MAG: restriction endonuclease subunit S [Gammaproteobacteria bacterium]
MSGHSVVPLRDLILESQNGLSKRSGADGVETPVLRLADIKAGAIDESDPREIRLTEKELAKYALQHGDLVCIRVNGSKALVGRVIQFRANRVWAYCDHFIRLRPNQALVDHRYLAHYFNSQTVRRHIELNMVSSAGQNTVSQGTMLDIPVPCPGLETQREIVAELEKQFSRLDEAVANLQRVKANLKRYKAAVLKAAVEGRLVETEATLARREGRTYETGEQLLQRILEERRAKWAGRGKWKAPEPPTTDATLPDGWTWASVDQLADVGTGATPKRDRAAYWDDGDVPWVTSSVVNGDYVDQASEFVTKLALAETNLTLYPIGTLLIAMYGEGKTRGKCTELRIPASTNQALAALQVDSSIRGYLRHFLELNYEEMRKFASGGVQPNLNLGLVRAVCVPLPPLAEQARIVAEVDRHLSILREVETEVDANLQRAQALRQSVLQRAFSTGSPNADDLQPPR